MSTRSKVLVVLSFILIGLPRLVPADDAAPIRVSCIGDSITAGVGAAPGKDYPDQLQGMLGPGWKVENDGVSARTLLNLGDFPYQKEAALQNALKFMPNVVVIMLGTNDTKAWNWKYKEEFVGDYKDLVGKFKALSSHPRIFVCLPVPVFGAGNYGINEAGIQEEIPMIRKVAAAEHVHVLDLHAALSGHDADFPDRVHPNDEGAKLMAEAVKKAITAKG